VTRRALLAVALLTVPAGCGDDDACGPGAAPDDGLTLSGDGLTASYAGLEAGANNDCPAPDAPEGVVALTIAGRQAGGTDFITFCVPRPDRLGVGALTLGTDVQVVDLFADAAGCSLRLATVPAPTGTVTASGACDDGTSPAGFALTFAGELAMERTCGATVDELRMTLAGTIAVAAQ